MQRTLRPAVGRRVRLPASSRPRWSSDIPDPHTLDRALIRTERLDIRPCRDADLDAFHAFDSDPEARHFLGGLRTRAETETGLRAHMRSVEASGLGARAVVERASDAVVGYCGLQALEGTGELELFYGYLRSAWGRGLATEAGRALIGAAGQCSSLDRLAAIAHPENAASLRVLRKLGFRPVGTYVHPRWNTEHVCLSLDLAAARSTRRE